MANNNSIKVLHLVSTLDIGGAEQSLYKLVTSMDGSAFKNEVVCMTRPGLVRKRLEGSGIPVSCLGMGKGVPDLRAVLRLRVTAGLMRPDIVQCWMYHANLLGIALLEPSKTLWNIRCSDMDLSGYGCVYRLTVKACARLSHLPAGIVVNSHAGRNVHTGLGYRPKEWAVIPGGFDTELFKPDMNARSRIRSEMNIPGDAFVTGLIARFDPMKDHATFFRAAGMFLKSNPEVHFILAGKGVNPANPSIKTLLPGTSPGGRFHLLDERDDVEQIFASLDIATSSSASEGFPNVIGEAMATGIPCAVTDVGDSKLLIGDTGTAVPKRDPQALCAAWQNLKDLGPAKLKEMGERARRRIIEHYSLSSMAGGYETLYKRLMARRERRRNS